MCRCVGVQMCGCAGVGACVYVYTTAPTPSLPTPCAPPAFTAVPVPSPLPRHSGYDLDLTTAAAVPELDLIIGGHTHTFLANAGRAPITDITNPAVTPDNCAALGACDVPVGPYPTFVEATTAAGARKRIPVVQAYFASK